MASKAARKWSQAQWGEVELGDKRRQRRAVAVGAALADASERSLPQQLQSRAATKATYRLMDCDEVTHAALLEPHRQATRHAAQACGLSDRSPGQVSVVPAGRCGSAMPSPRYRYCAVHPVTGIAASPSLRWSQDRTRRGSTRMTTRLCIMYSTAGRSSGRYVS